MKLWFTFLPLALQIPGALSESGCKSPAPGKFRQTGPRLTNALSHAYEAAEKISFEKLHKRSDIGLRALKALAEKE